jgi:hypothetical protein
MYKSEVAPQTALRFVAVGDQQNLGAIACLNNKTKATVLLYFVLVSGLSGDSLCSLYSLLSLALDSHTPRRIESQRNAARRSSSEP